MRTPRTPGAVAATAPPSATRHGNDPGSAPTLGRTNGATR